VTWSFLVLYPRTANTVSWVDCVCNVTAHAQKPDFVFRRNGLVHLNRRGVSVQSTTGSRGVRISGSNAGCTMFRGSVKSTGYPLHSPVSPSLPLSCVTVCHHISTGLYSPTAQRRTWLGLSEVVAWRLHHFTWNRLLVRTRGTFGQRLQT